MFGGPVDSAWPLKRTPMSLAPTCVSSHPQLNTMKPKACTRSINITKIAVCETPVLCKYIE